MFKVLFNRITCATLVCLSSYELLFGSVAYSYDNSFEAGTFTISTTIMEKGTSISFQGTNGTRGVQFTGYSSDQENIATAHLILQLTKDTPYSITLGSGSSTDSKITLTNKSGDQLEAEVSVSNGSNGFVNIGSSEFVATGGLDDIPIQFKIKPNGKENVGSYSSYTTLYLNF